MTTTSSCFDAAHAQAHALWVQLDDAAHGHRVRHRLGRSGDPVASWRETLPFGAADPRSLAARRRELEQALDARRPLRAVFLEHDDGVVVLCLVAARRLLTARGLRDWARSLVEDADGGPSLALPTTPAPTRSPPATIVWGLGGAAARAGRIALQGEPLACAPDDVALLAAIGTALSRLAGGAAVAIAVRRDGDRVTELRMAPAASSPLPALADAVRTGLDAATNPLDTEPAPAILVRLAPEPAPLAPRPSGAATVPRSPFALEIEIVSAGDAGAPCLHFDADAGVFSDGVLRWLSSAVQDLLQPAAPPVARTPVATAPARSTIDQLVLRQAERRPEARAITFGDEHLTWRQLAERATAMAHALRRRGVNPGQRVAVQLEPSLMLVPVLLAVLMTGAAYVPIDPACPPERRRFTLEDAAPALLVVDADTATQAGAALSLATLVAEAGEAGEPAAPAESPWPAHGADDAAYVIYTSGSTGRPKGVIVPHANVGALVDATAADFGLSTDDAWTLFHSTAFDFSVWEIWACLATGGRLVVVSHWVTRAPAQFLALLSTERVTVLNQTPSAFSQLQEADRQQALPLALRLVIFGGEPLDARSLASWFDRHPETSCRLVNMYGITETTVHVTAATLHRADALAGSRSVGRALPGWRVHVLDEHGRVQPPGVAGEIHVAGAGVSLGYLDRPELTAQRFVADPFDGGTMYRSGDLGRLRVDGCLEHLGRIDDQVKIRGFRIELDEIRKVLLDGEHVAAAAVRVRRDDPADPASARLDAYVVLRSGDVAAVRRHAAQWLPEHMRPATVTAMAALPLTHNGKLDVARLPAPEAAAPDVPARAEATPEADVAAPGHAADLLAIWREVMGEPIGLDEDFFEAGGNSLYAVRIAARLQQRGLPSMSLRDLYRARTVRAVAALWA